MPAQPFPRPRLGYTVEARKVAMMAGPRGRRRQGSARAHSALPEQSTRCPRGPAESAPAAKKAVQVLEPEQKPGGEEAAPFLHVLPHRSRR